MAPPKHIIPVDPEPLDPEMIDIEPMADDDGPVGRIVHDERGNAIWKWRGETSSTEDYTTSGVLKYIDPADLEVNEQAKTTGPTGPKSTDIPDPGGGYDPYNQGGAWNKSRGSGKSGRGRG